MPPNLPSHGSNLQRWLDNSAIESLMVSLAVIVLEMLVDHTSQMLFSEKDHSIASNGVNSTESRRFEIHWQVNPAID